MISSSRNRALEPKFRRQVEQAPPESRAFDRALRPAQVIRATLRCTRLRSDCGIMKTEIEKFRVRPLTATIAADGFHRTSFHRLFAERFLVRTLRLLIDVGVTTVIVARKICRRRLSAKIAINALIIHVKLPTHILRILICNVSHNLLYNLVSDSQT